MIRNYNTISIIGKYDEELGGVTPGAKYDSFEALLNDYLILLFYTLAKNGIVYSTNRNGILARVQFVDGQFVNYVQPAIGKWDFEDERYQRIVSLDFVLFLFNETCMADAHFELNHLAEPLDMNALDYSFHETFDLSDFSIAQIRDKYNTIEHEQYLANKGLPNKLDSYPTKEIEEIVLLNSILSKVTAYGNNFRKYQEMKKKAKGIKSMLFKKEVAYEDLTDDQVSLLENYGDNYDDKYDEYYPCLGYFYNHIKKGILCSLVREVRAFEEAVSFGAPFNGLKLAEKGIYYNPIKIFEGFDEETANIEITFEGAFEFDTYKNRFMREIKKHE